MSKAPETPSRHWPSHWPHHWHGRRKGKRLRAGRQSLLETLLPQLALHPEHVPFDPYAAFDPAVATLWLEIGFGAGEHLAWQAAHHPEIGMLGAEPFVNGVARLLSEIGRAGLGNIRLFADDAAILIDALPDACIGRCFVLYSDPWPKRRHHKRRFVSEQNLSRLARVMADRAELRLATDHAEYGRWMLARGLAHPAFDWPAERAADWRCRPADWPATRYEAKARAAGRRSLYLRFRRRPRGRGNSPAGKDPAARKALKTAPR